MPQGFEKGRAYRLFAQFLGDENRMLNWKMRVTLVVKIEVK
jgi:hypothetical protein